MASLSSLLNPEPMTQDDSHERKQQQEHQQVHSEHIAADGDDERHVMQASASLATDIAELPLPFPLIDANFATASHNMDLPQPAPASDARKMSSPTLDQYHVASRSPEHYRRPSFSLADTKELTLAPIQSQSHVADMSGEPAVKEQLPPVPAAVKPDVDMLSAPTTSSPSSHSPLATLKHEHSAHAQSPLRESSVPLQSTEMPPSSATASAVPRKRPPPKSAGKKGTASSIKREPTAKKRKTQSGTKRNAFPATKKLGSTSLNSSPAPRSIRNASTPPRSVASGDADGDGPQYSEDEEEDDDEDQGTPDPDAELYCLCRRPDTGTFMIGCDGGCDDWFHGKCVGIAERDKGLIDRYVCPRCTENGLGPTTWKRMCRRVGCRLPARTPSALNTKKGKRDTSSSKYCSDACGVQYFKDLVARTRGATRGLSSKDQDLGPRGGVLSAAELKAMVSVANGVDDFKRFGDDMLSPPATPSPTRQRAPSDTRPESHFTAGEQERISDIINRKDAARKKHSNLKDRLKFITMLKQTATTLAEERGLKPKEFCGFDTRMLWTDEEFDAWRTTAEAREGLTSGIMPSFMAQRTSIDADGDANMTNGDGNNATAEADPAHSFLCSKKRCTRHHDWAKLALDHVRFEMSENSEIMRGLDRDEKDILQRAGLRARVLKAGGPEGEVELHEQEPLLGKLSLIETSEQETASVIVDAVVAPTPEAAMIETTGSSEEQTAPEAEEVQSTEATIVPEPEPVSTTPESAAPVASIV